MVQVISLVEPEIESFDGENQAAYKGTQEEKGVGFPTGNPR